MKLFLCYIILLFGVIPANAQKLWLPDSCFITPDSFRKNTDILGGEVWYSDKIAMGDTIFFSAYYDSDKSKELCLLKYFIDKLDFRETVIAQYYYFNGTIASKIVFKNFNVFSNSLRQNFFSNIERIDINKMELGETSIFFNDTPIVLNKDSSDLHNFTIVGEIKKWFCDGTLKYKSNYCVDKTKFKNYLMDYSREVDTKNYTQTKGSKIRYTQCPSFNDGEAIVYFPDGSVFRKTFFKKDKVVWDSIFYKNNKTYKQITSLSVRTQNYYKSFDNNGRLADSIVYKIIDDRNVEIENYNFTYHSNGSLNEKKITLYEKRQILQINELFDAKGNQIAVFFGSYNKNRSFTSSKASYSKSYYDNGQIKDVCLQKLFFKLHKQYKFYNTLPDSLISLCIVYNENGSIRSKDYTKKNGDRYELKYYNDGVIEHKYTKIKNVSENCEYYNNGVLKSYFLQNNTKKIIRHFNNDGTLKDEEIITKPKNAAWR